MLHNRLTPDRKPFANSFLSVYYTIVSCRTGNYTQTVSCRYDTQSFHAGQETIRKQFPAAVIRNRHMTNRKPFANSFLPLCCTIVSRRIGNFYANSFLSRLYAIVPCRTGNLSQTVSCRGYTQSFYARQETFRKQLPAVMNHIRVPSDILIPPWTLHFSGPAEYPL